MMRLTPIILLVLFAEESTGFSLAGVSCKQSALRASVVDEGELEERLTNIARRLKLEIFDLDEGIYGFDSQDHKYGLEVVQTEIPVDGGLGLELTEMAVRTDGRGFVLISDVSGNAAKASQPIHVGDVITGVRTSDGRFRVRTAGFNYDEMVETINDAKQATKEGVLHLELNRMVERARILVDVEDDKGVVRTIESLAGENMRRLLQRKGIQVYDPRTTRFDMPYATGDCAGEGLCGTCLVEVKEGMEHLNPKGDTEKLITKGRPLSWRASCRTNVGFDNKEGRVKIVVKPQSKYEEELHSAVKSVKPTNH